METLYKVRPTTYQDWWAMAPTSASATVSMEMFQRAFDRVRQGNWYEKPRRSEKMATWGNIESDELKITQVANGFILKTPNSVFIFTSMKALFAHITQFYKDKEKDDE